MAKVVASGVVHLKDFVVVDEPGQLSILGPLSSQRLNLIHELIPWKRKVLHRRLPAVFKEYMDLFTGLGKLPVEHNIKLGTDRNSVDPVLSAAGRIPFS